MHTWKWQLPAMMGATSTSPFTGNLSDFILIINRFVKLSDRTEVIKKTVDPEWAKFSITVNQISGDNSNRKLKITVFHWSKKG